MCLHAAIFQQIFTLSLQFLMFPKHVPQPLSSSDMFSTHVPQRCSPLVPTALVPPLHCLNPLAHHPIGSSLSLVRCLPIPMVPHLMAHPSQWFPQLICLRSHWPQWPPSHRFSISLVTQCDLLKSVTKTAMEKERTVVLGDNKTLFEMWK